jgi:hypothetical protein
MIYRSFGAIIIAALVLTVSPSMAAVIIDQENDEPRSGYNDIGRTHWQSFMQAGDNIAGAAVMINRFGESGTMTLSIYDAEPGTGNLITSGSGVVDSALGSGDVFFTVFFTPVAVVPETELFLEITSDNDLIEIITINSSPYTRGAMYLDDSISGKGADLGFRTYTDDAFSASVPEPGALLIFGVGFVVLGINRRRRSA